MKHRVLVVDDEEKVRKISERYLEEAGFTVETAARGDAALEMVYENEPDLLVLDLMLPGISGEKVAEEIRDFSNLPILMLTARSSEKEKLEGFERGADDYVVKPFSPRELVARVKAILNRNRDFFQVKKVSFPGLELDVYPGENKFIVGGQEVNLTATEAGIFHILLEHRGQILSREQLARRAPGINFESMDRTIDVHVKNIRKKLSLPRDDLIETVYGRGYKMRDDICCEKS